MSRPRPRYPEPKTSLIRLFLLFAKISLITFGGGLAMLPILEREVVHKRDWATLDEMHDYYAISQITPGIIAVNTATFLGRKRRGNIGGITATLGVCFPTLVTVVLLAVLLKNIADNPILEHAFAGIRVGVVVLIGKSVIPLLKKSVKDLLTGIIFAVCFVLLLFFNFTPFDPIIYVVAVALVGIAYGQFIARRKNPPSAGEASCSPDGGSTADSFSEEDAE